MHAQAGAGTSSSMSSIALQRNRIVDIVTNHKRENSVLAADGFDCLTYSTNAGTWIGRSQFVWVRRASDAPDRAPISDVIVSVGDGMAPYRCVNVLGCARCMCTYLQYVGVAA